MEGNLREDCIVSETSLCALQNKGARDLPYSDLRKALVEDDVYLDEKWKLAGSGDVLAPDADRG